MLVFCITFLNLIYSICGTLHSVDQFLNIKLTDITVTDPDKYPHMVSQFVCINNSETMGTINLHICSRRLRNWLSQNVIVNKGKKTPDRKKISHLRYVWIFFSAFCEKLFYSWLCRALCSTSGWWVRHTTFTRRSTQRSSTKQTEVMRKVIRTDKVFYRQLLERHSAQGLYTSRFS